MASGTSVPPTPRSAIPAVQTEGHGAYGIFNSFSETSPIDNTGSVHTEGDNAFGIYNNSSDNSPLSNSGTVTTEGFRAIGINNEASVNSAVSNSGTVQTEGDDAYGVWNFFSTNAPVSNSGRIWTSGVFAEGIYSLNSTNSAITNSGLVVSERSDAIYLEDHDGVLNLLAPGFIGGRINLVSPTTVNLTSGPSHSVLWDLSTGTMVGDDPASFSGPVPWFYNSATKQYATYDPTGLAGAVNGLGDMTSMLSMVGRNSLGDLNTAPSSTSGFVPSYLSAEPTFDINQRIDQSFAVGASGPGSTGTYAFGVDAAATAHTSPGRFWITGFGAANSHDGDNSTLERNIDQMGVAAGYTWQQVSGLTLGVMAGYVKSSLDVESPFSISHDIESDGRFAGFYGEQAIGALTFDFGVNGGVLSLDSSRFVNDNLAPLGVAYAGADYDSWFISPEAGIRSDISIGNGLIFTPSARIRYARQMIDGYTETGTSVNATVGERNFGMLEASAEIALTKQVNFGSVSGSLGYVSRHSTGDDAVAVTMLGITKTLGFGNTDSEAATIGLAADINLTANSRLSLDTKAYLSGNMHGFQGMAKWVTGF